MFQKRLTWFWIGLTALALVIVGRLAQIQIVQAAEYEALAERIITRKPIYITAPRGAIRDLAGRALVRDEPSSDICLHYAVLTEDEQVRRDYLLKVARALRRRGEYAGMRDAEIAEALGAELPGMWSRLTQLTGVPQDEIQAAAARIVERVQRWRARAARGPIREENQLLPVVENVDPRAALAIRMELERLPWLRVLPSSHRVAQDADALVHILGRLGAAGPERLAADPFRDDEFRRLRPEDRCGVSGVERLAELALRGQRGRIVQDYNRQVLERVEPVPGRDVIVTIDSDLQQFILDELDQSLAEFEVERPGFTRAGAAVVVIDVATRELRALVSYPTYSYDGFSAEYGELERDARNLPLLFRAVQAQYPPGSICKTITLLGGLSTGAVTADTRIHCTGYLLPESPDRFRCWIHNLNPGLTHDMIDTPAGQDGASAVKHSCNIYFYRVGERLGPERLCEWFGILGLGRPAGTGLIEEALGIVPTAEYLQRTAGRTFQPADAWNFAIGQGEVTITPVQAANVAACIAAGEWAPVRLAYDASGHAFGEPVAPTVPLLDRHLQVLRRGMWRSVNERHGTGAPARMPAGEHELCGKTGSAQAQPRTTAYRYTFEWPDGSRREATAYLEADARAQFDERDLRCVGRHTVARYPVLEDGARLPAHAWFIGYTQSTRTPRGERPRGQVYALAVLIEYGGSGGQVAGPIAKRIAEYLVGQADDGAYRAVPDEPSEYGDPIGDD